MHVRKGTGWRERADFEAGFGSELCLWIVAFLSFFFLLGCWEGLGSACKAGGSVCGGGAGGRLPPSLSPPSPCAAPSLLQTQRPQASHQRPLFLLNEVFQAWSCPRSWGSIFEILRTWASLRNTVSLHWRVPSPPVKSHDLPPLRKGASQSLGPTPLAAHKTI